MDVGDFAMSDWGREGLCCGEVSETGWDASEQWIHTVRILV